VLINIVPPELAAQRLARVERARIEDGDPV
jgi:hypothetical protein